MARPISYCKIDNCTSRCVSQGLCRKHYARFRRHGDPHSTPRWDNPEIRFWRYVEKTNSCWLWRGAKSNNYGRFALSQRPTVIGVAHRLSYEYLIGPIPREMYLHHTCLNKSCVNPSHLIPVTPKAHQSIQHKVTHCKHGHSLENAYVYKDGNKKGHRKCRPCEANRMRVKRSNLL